MKACRVLFGNGRFLCRSCWGIGYRSQRELHARVGGSANLMEPFPPRPRYLHYRTYQRLRARYLSLSGQHTVELEGFVSRLKRRIGAP
jgi:hypothetical protein